MAQEPKTKIVGHAFLEQRYGIGLKKNTFPNREGFLPFLNTWLAGAIRERHVGSPLRAAHCASFKRDQDRPVVRKRVPI